MVMNVQGSNGENWALTRIFKSIKEKQMQALELENTMNEMKNSTEFFTNLGFTAGDLAGFGS
jgi:hypothetical protein